MTEKEVFEMILGIKEIQVDRRDGQDRSLHMHCRSIFEEARGPHCRKKRRAVNPTSIRQCREGPRAGHEVYGP